MRWSRVVGSFVVSVSVFAGCGDGDGTKFGPGCSKDTDCKGDRICVKGACVGGAEAGISPGAGEAGIGDDAARGNSGNGGSPAGAGGGTGGRATGGVSAAASGGTSAGTDAGSQGGAGTGPECTRTDVSACHGSSGLPACCTRAGTCGSALGLLGCVADPAPTDGGRGTGGTGGGLIGNPACVSCRATSCPQELARCEANAKCKALSACLDAAALPFGVITCVGGADAPATAAYNAMSSCASSHCTTCANITL